MRGIRLRVLATMIGLLLVGLWIIISMPNGLDSSMSRCYYAIIGTFAVMSIISIYAVSRSDFDIFEPIILLLIMYFGIFVFRPIADIKNGDYFTFGVDPLGGGVKANIIICISLISFCIGYYKTFTISGNRIANEHYFEDENEELGFESRQEILYKAYIIWGISFAASVFNLILSGKDTSYIFSLGNSGFASDDATAGGIAALSFFSFSMIAPWLYICIYEKKKALIAITSFLMICIYVVRGTRIVLLIMLSAPILYHYLSKGKRPKLKTVICGAIILLLIMSIVQMTRNGLRTGSETSIENFSEVAFTNVFDADLTTYKQFYCIVENYPSRYNYTLGKAIVLQTLITIIPRSLWHSKPDPIITEVIKNAVNQRAADSGMASPGIGEYYFEFGVIGCIICMCLLGCLFKRWNKLKNFDDVESWVKYSALYGLIFQLIIRTSTASCVYQYLFTVLPIYFITRTKLLSKE